MVDQSSADVGLRELALFAGAGGGILGGYLLGWRTVCAVEQDAYAACVLVQRQNEGILPAFPIWDDVRTFDGKPWRGCVDVVSGGFPCQDISAAGRGAGIDGERSGLWGEMARIVSEVRPRFVFVENSPLLVRRGLSRVLGDLTALGYDCRWGVVGAVDAGAPHQRHRIWIVANAEGFGWRSGFQQDERQGQSANGSITEFANDGCTLANAMCQRGAGLRDELAESGGNGQARANCEENGDSWWSRDPADPIGTAKPELGRVADGVAYRVDRLRAIGNGQVPAVAAMAWRILTGSK